MTNPLRCVIIRSADKGGRSHMQKRIAVFMAVMTMLCVLAGCSRDNGTSGNDISDAASTEQVSMTEEPALTEPAVEETTVIGHDLDPLAIAHSDEMIPYFFSTECEEVTFYPSEDAVKRMGRYIEYKDIYYLSYSCSGVSFLFTGDRVEAVLTSNGSVYSDNQQGFVGVIINGELTKRIQLESGDNTYTLYDGEMLENAEFAIVKLSENQMATTGIVSITANAKKIAPKGKSDLQIEFIGDSIACGYGNEADDPSDGYNSAQQNATATYCYYTAEDLNADFSVVAISGIGLISDYTDTVGEREDYLLMPDVYGYTDANFELRRGYEELTPWDFKGGSDIVVINLGTNDYSYTGRDEYYQGEFFDAYYKFLGTVREANPDAEIVCTLGIMGSELLGQIEGAANAYSEDTGDERVHIMKFDYQDEEDGYGGDYHPSVATQRKAADQLTEYLRGLLSGEEETAESETAETENDTEADMDIEQDAQ